MKQIKISFSQERKKKNIAFINENKHIKVK